MSLQLYVQIACNNVNDIPHDDDFERWVTATLDEQTLSLDPELTIRIVDKQESEMLNANFRQQQKPTNVLSFPFEQLPHQHIAYLGDLAICAPVVIDEAHTQHKSVISHWAHLTIHGVLHLLGYDHQADKDAEEMEALEIQIMSKLGFDNPY